MFLTLSPTIHILFSLNLIVKSTIFWNFINTGWNKEPKYRQSHHTAGRVPQGCKSVTCNMLSQASSCYWVVSFIISPPGTSWVAAWDPGLQFTPSFCCENRGARRRGQGSLDSGDGGQGFWLQKLALGKQKASEYPLVPRSEGWLFEYVGHMWTVYTVLICHLIRAVYPYEQHRFTAPLPSPSLHPVLENCPSIWSIIDVWGHMVPRWDPLSGTHV